MFFRIWVVHSYPVLLIKVERGYTYLLHEASIFQHQNLEKKAHQKEVKKNKGEKM